MGEYKRMPLVSIITPCYNASVFIQQTIDSVINQTYPYWELLVVDDCSTDDSTSIIRYYAEKDKRIKYLSTEKASGSPAKPRNIGLDNAAGDYIAMLDADDFWLPMKLEEQIRFLENNRYDFVYSDYEKVDCEGKRCGRIVKGRLVSTYNNTLNSNDIPCLTTLIKKELVNNVRFEFEPPGREDFVVWLKILKAGHKAYNTGKVHALYRQDKNSISGDKFIMFKRQWYVLRNIEKLDLFSAVSCILKYAIRGYFKYLK